MDTLTGPSTELLVAIVFTGVLVICIWCWLKFGDFSAIAYAIPSLYVAATYFWIVLVEPEDDLRRLWVRLGLLLFAVAILFERRDYMKWRKR